jgi:hypothetical protein
MFLNSPISHKRRLSPGLEDSSLRRALALKRARMAANEKAMDMVDDSAVDDGTDVEERTTIVPFARIGIEEDEENPFQPKKLQRGRRHERISTEQRKCISELVVDKYMITSAHSPRSSIFTWQPPSEEPAEEVEEGAVDGMEKTEPRQPSSPFSTGSTSPLMYSRTRGLSLLTEHMATSLPLVLSTCLQGTSPVLSTRGLDSASPSPVLGDRRLSRSPSSVWRGSLSGWSPVSSPEIFPRRLTTSPTNTPTHRNRPLLSEARRRHITEEAKRESEHATKTSPIEYDTPVVRNSSLRTHHLRYGTPGSGSPSMLHRPLLSPLLKPSSRASPRGSPQLSNGLDSGPLLLDEEGQSRLERILGISNSLIDNTLRRRSSVSHSEKPSPLD